MFPVPPLTARFGDRGSEPVGVDNCPFCCRQFLGKLGRRVPFRQPRGPAAPQCVRYQGPPQCRTRADSPVHTSAP